MLRIGEINYLNCVPLFSMLKRTGDAADYLFVSGHPSLLNASLRDARIDVCPSSSIEFARNPHQYLILPDISISSYADVKSVLLFSRRRIELLDHVPIGMTIESDTSVALLKILLSRRFGFTNSYYHIDGSARNLAAGHDALLLIGDQALKGACHPEDYLVYDLGRLWTDFTGLPFVFALWLLREDALTRDPETVRAFHRRLIEAKSDSIRNFAQIAAELPENDWIGHGFLTQYWESISYELTADHIQGLQLFYRYAAECGLIAQVPTLRMYSRQAI